MDQHLVALGVGAGRVTPEDHRQPVGRQADPTQRPDIVMVEGGGPDIDRHPPLGRGRCVDLTNLQAGQRIVGGMAGGIGSEHASTLPTYPIRFRRIGRARPLAHLADDELGREMERFPVCASVGQDRRGGTTQAVTPVGQGAILAAAHLSWERTEYAGRGGRGIHRGILGAGDRLDPLGVEAEFLEGRPGEVEPRALARAGAVPDAEGRPWSTRRTTASARSRVHVGWPTWSLTTVSESRAAARRFIALGKPVGPAAP